MFKKLFDRIFRSLFWKAAVICLLLGLVGMLLRMFQTLRALQQTLGAGGPRLQRLALEIDSVYVWGTVAGVLLTLIVLAGFADLLISLRIARRFREVTEVINRIADGQLSERVTISTLDEIGRLGMTFNRMADIVENSIEQLRKTDRLRRELVANVAHDLGGPATSIQGYCETVLLKENQLTAQQKRHFLEIILNNAKSLAKLVSELFDLSKFDAAIVEPKFETFSIPTLARDVASRLQQQAWSRRVSIQVSEGRRIPLVRADLSMIERVLTNLVENALRFSKEDDVVEILFEQQAGDVMVSVRDHGVGIPPEALPHLFERFYRVAKDRSRSTGGAGLGLAIVKHIIRAHGRSIQVNSTVGGGTTFTFSLESV